MGIAVDPDVPALNDDSDDDVLPIPVIAPPLQEDDEDTSTELTDEPISPIESELPAPRF